VGARGSLCANPLQRAAHLVFVWRTAAQRCGADAAPQEFAALPYPGPVQVQAARPASAAASPGVS